ncbi:hypothetical protein HPB50_025903 [Hyalomma asiaticum]|uniref:Uncharacterized protein n=1 Tax=Hyalomma asiaticum TaxID=266040 RepID=A0ACB7RU28_HYAAI|nr:hypothetical protein HPB50_025903 [Hyalomma asiaticum]
MVDTSELPYIIEERTNNCVEGYEAEEEEEEEGHRMMGNALRKGLGNQRSGCLTDREKTLIRNTWRKFCEKNPDYGVRIFIAMFTEHPEYLQLFPRFRNKGLRTLRNDAKFRAHACAVGHQLSAIVECIEDDEVMVELIRKNAANHLKRAGVRPSSFESLSSATLEEMMASNGPLMTPDTVRAWEKLFEIMNTITRNVYEEAGIFSTTSEDTTSGDEISLPDSVGAIAADSNTNAAKAAGASSAQAPLTVQETTAGTSEKLAMKGQDSAPGMPRASTTAPARNVSGMKVGSVVLGEGSGASSNVIAESAKPRTPAPAVKTGVTQATRAAPSTMRSAASSETITKKTRQDASSQ